MTRVNAGDHVVVAYTSCGECRFCRKGETAYCKDWFQYNFGGCRLDGSKAFSAKDSDKPITSHFFGQSSFARHTLVHENGLVKIGREVPFYKAAALACGNMTGAGGTVFLIPEYNPKKKRITDGLH